MFPVDEKKRFPPRIAMIPKCLTALLAALIWIAMVGASGSALAAGDEESDVAATYKRFALAFIRGDLALAASLAEGNALRVVRRKRRLVDLGEEILPPVGSEFMVIGENPSEDGRRVELLGVHVVRNRKPGSKFVTTAIHRQNATLEQGGQEWKIIEFQDDLEQACHTPVEPLTKEPTESDKGMAKAGVKSRRETSTRPTAPRTHRPRFARPPLSWRAPPWPQTVFQAPPPWISPWAARRHFQMPPPGGRFRRPPGRWDR